MEQLPAEKKFTDETFQYGFSPVMIAFFCLGLALCAAGFALNTWQLVIYLQSGTPSFYDWMKFVLLYFASVVLAVFILAMLIKSQYVVTDTQLITQFGIIRSRYDIKKIFSISEARGSGKINLNFDDFKTKFVVISVKESWYSDFIRALTARNERIEFDFISPEQKPDRKN